MTSLLVGTETDLCREKNISRLFLILISRIEVGITYRGHGHVASEPSSNSIVDTLRLSPAGGKAFEPITLVTVEALGSCKHISINISC